MKKGLALSLLLATAAFSQTTQIGIGVGMEKTITFSSSGSSNRQLAVGLLPVTLTTFSIPILLADIFTLEPELGYARFSTTEKSDANGEAKFVNSILQLGIGLSGCTRVDKLSYTFGFRTGMVRTAMKNEFEGRTSDISQTNFHLGPILGAEYFFIPKMSLGAQIGFSYIIIGDENVETSPSTPPTSSEPSVDQSILGNNAKIVLRWYY